MQPNSRSTSITDQPPKLLRTPTPRVLLVTTGQLLEVFCETPLLVHHGEQFADLKGASAELLGEEILERELPHPYRKLFFPGLRRFSAFVEPRTLTRERARLDDLRLLRAIKKFGRDLRAEAGR